MLAIPEAAFVRLSRLFPPVLFALGLALAASAVFGATNSSAAFTVTDWKLTPSSLQAGGHPNVNFHIDPDAVAGDRNGDDLKSVQIDFAAGMLANPQAVATPCTTLQFNADACPPATQIGTLSLQYRKSGFYSTMPGSLYELTPDADSAMTFGFIARPSGYRKLFLRSSKVSGVATVRTGLDADYGITATINAIPRTLTTVFGLQTNITISNINVNLFARSGATQNGPFLSFAPTGCTPAPARAKMTSYLNVVVTKTSTVTPTGCTEVQFAPGFSIAPASTQAGRATGVSATLTMPTADAPIQQSHVRDVNVILPKGTGLNLANIGAVPALCSDAQLAADACPAGSRIGDAGVDVPFLPPMMTGGIYLLTRDSSISFGYVLRGARGTTAILRGSAAAIDQDGDGASDAVRTTLVGLPQAPFSSATLNFTAALIDNPQLGCGSATVSATISGYSGAAAALTAPYPLENCVTPPDTAIDSGPSGLTSSTQPLFSFSADKPTIRFECSVDGVAFTTCVSPLTTAVLSQGDHSFAVRGVNIAGADAEPASSGFTVDSMPPAVIITSPNEGASLTTADVAVEFTTEQNADAVCSLDGTAATACASPFAATALATGEHSFSVTAIDAAGNSSTATRTFSVLGQGVAVSITSPFDGESLGIDSFTAQFSASSGAGPITGYTCRIDNVPNDGQYTIGPCEPGQFFGGMSVSQHLLTVTATDSTGASASATVAFNVTARAPYGPYVDDGPLSAIASDRTPTFLLSSVDADYPAALFQCAITPLGGTPSDWRDCGSGASQFTSPDVLPDGDYSLWTRSVDGAVAGFRDEWNFTVGTFDASFSAKLSTTQAGAHPNLDVDIKPAAGQLRLNDLYLPTGLLGGLTAFPKCPVETALTGVCPSNTTVGNAATAVTLQQLQLSAKQTKGPVYLTEPYEAGDSAGFMVKINPPIGGVVRPVLIPLRIILSGNGEQLRVFSDSIPTSAPAWNAGDPNLDYYVSQFIMHINGASGSPYPLMTNPSSCEESQFNATIGDLEGNAVNIVQPFQATGCDTVPFAPTFTQTWSNPVAGGLTGVNTVITLPDGSSSIDQIRVLEPPALAPNFPSFGNAEDQCPSTSAPTATDLFDPTECPGQARVGMMLIHSPLLPTPLVGDVYLINNSPLPWFGVVIDDEAMGVHIRLTGVTGTPQVDPACNPLRGQCQTQIAVQFSDAPDVATSSIEFDLSGPPRTGANGATLSGDIVRVASRGASTCVQNAPLTASIKPHSSPLPVVITPTIPLTGC